MSTLVNAVRWDWYKLARRWMPWVLLIILLLMSQLGVWVGFLTYQGLRKTGATVITPAVDGRPPTAVNCRDLFGGRSQALSENTPDEIADDLRAQCQQEQARVQDQLVRQYGGIMLPGSIPTALNLGLSVALILLAILTASHLGAEYGWGTVRTNLARGTGRWRYLAAKLILLAVVTAGALLAVVAATALSSIAARHLAPAPALFASSETWRQAATVLGKGWLALIPYLALSGMVTVLSRSSSAGMAIATGYYLGEQVVVAIAGSLSGRVHSVARYLLGQNIDAWAGISFLGQGHTNVGATHALLVLVTYTVALGGVTFWLFERRDVTGPSAG